VPNAKAPVPAGAFANFWSERPTIYLWAGHKDMATTMRYIKPNRSPEVKANFNATFAGV